MTATDLELVDLTKIVGELQVPCDYSQSRWCPNHPAKWAATVSCPGCGWTAHRLLCDCKDFLMVTEDCIECKTCGEIVAPARHAFKYIEAIDRRHKR